MNGLILFLSPTPLLKLAYSVGFIANATWDLLQGNRYHDSCLLSINVELAHSNLLELKKDRRKREKKR